MAEQRYTTIIPAFDIDAGKEYQGIFTLIGSDYSEMGADEIGMTPVVVTGPGDHNTADGIKKAWTSYLRYLFGAEPDPDAWWVPVNGGVGAELFTMVGQWIRDLTRDAYGRGVVDWHAESDMEEQMLDSRLVPFRVAESACNVCARPGGWTLVLTVLLHQETVGGPLRRWVWNKPAAQERAAAERSHVHDIDDFTDRCMKIWEVYKTGLAEDDEERSVETFLDLAESPYEDYIGDIETQATEDAVRDAKEAHHPLWFPTLWLIEDSLDAVTQMSKIADRRYGNMTRRSLDLTTEPLDIWLRALLTEYNIRMSLGGMA